MASKTASAFVEKIPDFITFLKETGLEGKLQSSKVEVEPVPIIANHPFNGKTIVVTGLTERRHPEPIKVVVVHENLQKILVDLLLDILGKATGAPAELLAHAVAIRRGDDYTAGSIV